jgi:SecD/SecF fusion protein
MKRKRWQFWLIVAVASLTLYNILPTLFFYTKPLNKPIDEKFAEEITSSVISRVNQLETDAVDWLKSFSKLVGVSPQKISVVENNPQMIEIQLTSSKEAQILKTYLPRAGSLIPFYPSQLAFAGQSNENDSAYTVSIQRNIPLQFKANDAKEYFSFGKMHTPDGSLTTEYREILKDRLLQIGLILGGTSENASLLDLSLRKESAHSQEFLYVLAQNILNIEKIFSTSKEAQNRYFANFTQGAIVDKQKTIKQFISSLISLRDSIQMEKLALKEQIEKGDDSAKESLELASLETKSETLLKAIGILKNRESLFAHGQAPWELSELKSELSKHFSDEKGTSFHFPMGNHNPIIAEVILNAEDQTITLTLKEDIIHLLSIYQESNEKKNLLDGLNRLIYEEIAKVSRESGESVATANGMFVISLSDLSSTSAFIKFNLASIAKAQYENVLQLLTEKWAPESTDLKRESYPIMDWKEHQALPSSQKHLQLVLYAPSLANESPVQGFRSNSIYVIAKDLGKIAAKFQSAAGSKELEKVKNDFDSLSQLLQKSGFSGYPGSTYPLPAEYVDDYIFEISDYYLPLLQATRENFKILGTKQYAILELSDVKERILTQNRIETRQHEDLLKWRDEYLSAKVDLNPHAHYSVPAPTKNALFDNLLLSARKYFRGDERKILHWGLDLSGGKTVQIALRDSNGKTVTNELDIKQGINELYDRVNKMGVSDVSIRQEGNNITIDFPGSQGISASQLVKASSMTFNIVNEKFSTNGSFLSSEVNRFLQEVWNEAVVTNKKDIESINLIAWKHLTGDFIEGESFQPRSDAAKALLDNGFMLADPYNPEISSNFNDAISRIGLYRGENYTEWNGQTHPLMILFKNYALEGANLENVQASYDPTKGNFLSFQIKNSVTLPSGKKIFPRKELYSWTSVFSKETISGSSYESFSRGAGWRMAVVLNGYIVSTPHLEAPLQTNGTITGHFTQREINQLASDLKAGSLSFTPQILSEKSVSPELGAKEREEGILATVIALVSVIALMTAYYRFSGVVASVAVIFNLFIIWAVLQNIGASITLAELAGVILTVGMAVDANVLVFERIREEFARTGKIAASVSAGYRRAFSAIFDSNVTTIIAAVILLNFDSGPIKGFALSLIIGIISSMFTSLFMTKYFFSKWIENPKHTHLRMANLIKPQKWDFLKYGKIAVLGSSILIVVGGAALWKSKNTIFGMDFTGGYSINIEVEKTGSNNYRLDVEKALSLAGLSSREVQVRELTPSNQLRLFLSNSLDHEGKPFYKMPLEEEIEFPRYSYETNPRLNWLVSALSSSGIELTENTLSGIDQGWKSISGQMSDSMRNNAVIGLCLALLAILVYVTIRFEFKYAVSATLGLGFDLLITLGLVGILHSLNVGLQIDLNTVAALMTIVGYSLNDTIIVFDRIREDVKIMRRESFKEIINHALNITLSRTILTSGTTLVVLLALVLFGGSSIFGFSLVMSIGVIVGTLSTFFIATTLLLFLQKNRPEEEETIISIS